MTFCVLIFLVYGCHRYSSTDELKAWSYKYTATNLHFWSNRSVKISHYLFSKFRPTFLHTIISYLLFCQMCESAKHSPWQKQNIKFESTSPLPKTQDSCSWDYGPDSPQTLLFLHLHFTPCHRKHPHNIFFLTKMAFA